VLLRHKVNLMRARCTGTVTPITDRGGSATTASL
jgi:hypothetical protein